MRKLIPWTHPDKSTNDENKAIKAEISKQCLEAWQTLNDESLRKDYIQALNNNSNIQFDSFKGTFHSFQNTSYEDLYKRFVATADYLDENSSFDELYDYLIDNNDRNFAPAIERNQNLFKILQEKAEKSGKIEELYRVANLQCIGMSSGAGFGFPPESLDVCVNQGHPQAMLLRAQLILLGFCYDKQNPENIKNQLSWVIDNC